MAAIFEIINQIDRSVTYKFCNAIINELTKQMKLINFAILLIIIYQRLHYLKLQIKTAKDATCTVTDLDFTNL